MMEGISSRGRLARRAPEASASSSTSTTRTRSRSTARPRMAFTEDVAQALRGLRLARPARRQRQHRPRRDRCARSATANAEDDRPSIIVVRTTIGYGSPHKAGTSAAHGSPLGAEEVAATKKALGWEWEEPFHEPPEALAHFRDGGRARQRRSQGDWERALRRLGRGESPSSPQQWRHGAARASSRRAGTPDLPTWKAGDKALATRVAGGKAMNAIAEQGAVARRRRRRPLRARPRRSIKAAGDFDGADRRRAQPPLRRPRARHGGDRQRHGATTAASARSSRPSSASPTTCGRRCASRRSTELPVIFVWTHDSIGLGEDGPTHQPIEHCMSLRAMPRHDGDPPRRRQRDGGGLAGDHASTARAPIGLVLCRAEAAGRWTAAARGRRRRRAARTSSPRRPAARRRLILIATGSEVQLAVAGRARSWRREGIPARVVSMPCWEILRASSPRSTATGAAAGGAGRGSPIEAGVDAAAGRNAWATRSGRSASTATAPRRRATS